MSWHNDGGPAFPVPLPAGETYKPMPFDGMSLRDYFAAKAMQGIQSNPSMDFYFNDLAEAAYQIADAMLAARSQS